jgi:RNA polymerase sigma factor (sigma-70 family)
MAKFLLLFRAVAHTSVSVATPDPSNRHESEQVRQAQQGDPEALAELRLHSHARLVHILLARGANPNEAEDILADLWSECVPGAGGKPSLLAKFGGRHSLLGWLARVASNRWVDLKRRGARHTGGEESQLEDLPGCPTELQDDNLLTMLRESLRTAFANCPGQAMILLRLVYVHGLTQREVGRMVGWSESKISRAFSQAMEQIKTQTLRDLRRRDPGLELSWEDFLGLCDEEKTDFL